MLGASTPKPTQFLTANLPQLLLDLHSNRVRTELPLASAIGTDKDGHWKTSALKEYPPALCRGLAVSFARGFAQTPIDPSIPEPNPASLAQYTTMNVQQYGEVLGADFAG